MRVEGPFSAEQYRRELGREMGLANRGRKQTPEHIAKTHAPEARAKISASHIGRKQTPEHIAKTHTPESNAKRSVTLTGRKHALKSNEKQSKTISQGILEGRIHPEKGKSGYFWSEKNQKKVHYRSRLELHWYELLEQLEKVERYDVEPVAIPYEWNGSIHLYHPDLMIVYTDHTLELVEIKPEGAWYRDNPQTQAKFIAARKWCESSGRRIVFRVWGYKELKTV